MTAPIKVTREEYTPQDLRRMAASMRDAGHARRLQAISFVLDGWPRSREAEFADVDRQTLRDWVERYNEGCVGALATFTSPGRRRLLTPNQAEKLCKIVEHGPDLDKDGVVRWRRVDLVQQSAARFSVPEVHPSTMGRWLHRLDLTKLTTRPHHPKKDEAAQQAFKDNFKDIVNEKLPAAVKKNGAPVEFWFQSLPMGLTRGTRPVSGSRARCRGYGHRSVHARRWCATTAVPTPTFMVRYARAEISTQLSSWRAPTPKP